MATPTELSDTRNDAGIAYADALEALRTAWINLRALDIACEVHPVGAHAIPVYSLGNPNSGDISALRHPVYAENLRLGEWEDAAKAAAQTHTIS